MHFNKPVFASNIFPYGAVVVQSGVVLFLSFIWFGLGYVLSETTRYQATSTLTLCVGTKDQPNHVIFLALTSFQTIFSSSYLLTFAYFLC